jgi:hypothetical protein
LRFSKCQLQAELNFAIVSARRSNVAECPSAKDRSRIVEVRMIQEVEQLGAKLQS